MNIKGEGFLEINNESICGMLQHYINGRGYSELNVTDLRERKNGNFVITLTKPKLEVK